MTHPGMSFADTTARKVCMVLFVVFRPATPPTGGCAPLVVPGLQDQQTMVEFFIEFRAECAASVHTSVAS